MTKWISLLAAALLASMLMVGCQPKDTTEDPAKPETGTPAGGDVKTEGAKPEGDSTKTETAPPTAPTEPGKTEGDKTKTETPDPTAAPSTTPSTK